MRYEFVQAMAESFSGVTPIESACYHYLCNSDSVVRAAYHKTLYNYFYNKAKKTKPINQDHLDRIVRAALYELTFPVKAGKDYAWTIKDRCAQTRLSRMTWYRHQYDDLTCAIIDSVLIMSERVEMLTSRQLRDYYRPEVCA